MIRSKYNWTEYAQEPSSDFLEAGKEEGLSEFASKILYQRGVTSSDELRHFLHDDLSNLHDPFLFHDMERAVERIRTAIENYEMILVYGDYDADGMTSASIMKETLEMMGAECQIYLPNRFTDGYGPNQSVYEYFIEQQQVSLIITVDNGVAGHEAIAYAKEKGVDVIVTDHHSMPDPLPDAYAIIHPEHPESQYPFKELAGCGVAFKLATALLGAPQVEMLDLVAIGTIADMMSLTGENRILVKIGLEILRQTERIGLQELLAISNTEMDTINEETVGFKIAPQLNALGRLDDPNPAIELLTGFDDEEAQQIAIMIDEKNEERKKLVQDIYQEAEAMIDPNRNVQVLAKDNWHPGVLGIVAGRLLESYSQPIVMLTIDGDTAKGSARSVEQVDIFKALNHHRDLFLAFGGHSGAAGMTLKLDKLDELAQVLEDYIVQESIDLTAKKKLMIDGELDLSSLDLDLIDELEQLAPFGMANPKPVFKVKPDHINQVRQIGSDKSHLKCRLEKGSHTVDLLAFSSGHLAQDFQQLSDLEFAVTLSTNTWNGTTSLQLMMEDVKVEGIQLYDIRGRQFQAPSEAVDLLANPQASVVVLNEIPENVAELAVLFKENDYEAIYFKNILNNKTNYFLTGFGSRDQYAKLYRALYQFKEFDVRYKLKELSQYLNIPVILLIKMIQIFDELNFVQIKDGVMTVNKDAEKREISESVIYQDLVELVKFQELISLGTPQEILNFLKNY